MCDIPEGVELAGEEPVLEAEHVVLEVYNILEVEQEVAVGKGGCPHNQEDQAF